MAADEGAREAGRQAERREAEHGFSDKDVEDIEDKSRLRAPMIYEVVRREGDEEMRRPITSLWWSGSAAGLSISFSLLAEGILTLDLPKSGFKPLLTSLGYPVGFLMVVLARQQLFTENTIRAVLPVFAKPTVASFARLGRMWGIVFAANMAGTLVAALFCTFAPVISPGLREAMLDVSRSLMTYLIAIGGFAHIVAGSVEAFMLVVNGELPLGHMIADFTVPVLFGNIAGGTALFALISYAQIKEEL